MKDIFNKVTEKVNDAKEAVTDGLDSFFNLEKVMDKFSNINDGAKEKYVQFTSDLIALSPIIEEIGFKTKEITLSMGIPPSFTFHFEKFQEITAERRNAILDQHNDNKFLRPIVKMLITADQFEDKIALGGFRFNCIEISLGLTPGVNLVLVPKVK